MQYFEDFENCFSMHFSVERYLCNRDSGLQEIVIFENQYFGKVLVLDGLVQTTERDEFIYHETLAHNALFSHRYPQSILIIGGGDGGTLREACKHLTVEKIVQVELDRDVVRLCREYMPSLSAGCFNDSRLQLVFDDAISYLKESTELFDVIISDSTDPTDLGQGLFSEEFFYLCKNHLRSGGIFSMQCGLPMIQPEELSVTSKSLTNVFRFTSFYCAAIPSYFGGLMSFALCRNGAQDSRELEEVRTKIRESRVTTHYFNSDIYEACGKIPGYFKALGAKSF